MANKVADKYLVVSKLTNRIYIDEKRNAMLFFSKEKAKEYSDKIPNTAVFNASPHKFIDICSLAYGSGASVIVLKSNNKEEEIRLQKEKLNKKYYNSNLNANIARYLHTKDNRYIKAFENSQFIVPIRIQNHPNANITYATAIIKNEPYVFVAFTDVNEFNNWSKKIKGWQALEIDAAGFKRIGKKHGFIINPFGRYLIVTRTMMNMIKTEDDEEGEYR